MKKLLTTLTTTALLTTTLLTTANAFNEELYNQKRILQKSTTLGERQIGDTTQIYLRDRKVGKNNIAHSTQATIQKTNKGQYIITKDNNKIGELQHIKIGNSTLRIATNNDNTIKYKKLHLTPQDKQLLKTDQNALLQKLNPELAKYNLQATTYTSKARNPRTGKTIEITKIRLQPLQIATQ